MVLKHLVLELGFLPRPFPGVLGDERRELWVPTHNSVTVQTNTITKKPELENNSFWNAE